MFPMDMDIFRQYLIVGGMSQAVETFAGTHDLGLVDAQKRDILELFAGIFSSMAA